MANPEDLVAVVEQLVQRVASLTDKLEETNKQLQNLAEGSGESGDAPGPTTEHYTIPEGYFIESDVRPNSITMTQQDVNQARECLIRKLSKYPRVEVKTFLDTPFLVIRSLFCKILFPCPRSQMPFSNTRASDFSLNQLRSLAHEELAQWPWQDAVGRFLSGAEQAPRNPYELDKSVMRQSIWFAQNSQGVIHVDKEPSSSRRETPPSRDLQYDQIFLQDSSLQTFYINEN